MQCPKPIPLDGMRSEVGRREPPVVSIGLPVYNGERFVAAAIDSILSQTFSDFELIVSDNASTDATERICREYAARDSRIRYYRSEANRGAAWNHNRVVELARAEYFKWQCYDDLCAPTFLETCLVGLERDPSVVLCYPQFVRIDDQGNELGRKSSSVSGMAPAHERFRSLLYRRDSCEEIYGVARTDVVRRTRLIGNYSNSDDTFLAEMILRGRFREASEPLFFYRIHKAQSTTAYPGRIERTAWFDTSTAGKINIPFATLFKNYVSLIWRSPVRTSDKARCYGHLLLWCWRFRWWPRQDVKAAWRVLFHGRIVPFCKRQVPWTRPIWHRMKRVLTWLGNTAMARVMKRRPSRWREVAWSVGPQNNGDTTSVPKEQAR